MMLQQDKADDYVVATNEMHSVREFVELAFSIAGIKVEWKGKAEKEIGIDAATGETIVAIDPRFYRPTEVEQLLGNPAKAKEKLGWEPKVKFAELVKIMTVADCEAVGIKL